MLYLIIDILSSFFRHRQAEADLQRSAEGGGPEAEGRSGRGEGASGEADPGGVEQRALLAGRRRAGEGAGAVPRCWIATGPEAALLL